MEAHPAARYNIAAATGAAPAASQIPLLLLLSCRLQVLLVTQQAAVTFRKCSAV
jgi:hypothetical protein